MTSEHGYSIVELLIAMGLMLSVVAGALSVVSGMHLGLGTEAERIDAQQRLRVAVDALSGDLMKAGTGAYQGWQSSSSRFPAAAVFPFRQGAVSPDPVGTVRTSVLTLASVAPQSAAQTTLALPMPARSGVATIQMDPGCPTTDVVCGFASGMDVMIFDDTGGFDTFRVTLALPGSLQLQHTMPDTAQMYPAGSTIVEAVSRTYYLKTDSATDTFQLVRYDGVSSDAAVVDHVVGLAFDYYGEALPPEIVKPVTDPAGPWTTYGPKPPLRDVQTTAYPAGENCAFQLDPTGSVHVPRLVAFGVAGATLVKLTAAQLQDGPWCPDDLNAHRYDADLLRIRRVSVTLRVEAASSALRGPAGVLFARAGTARAGSRWVPDQEIRFDISPPNLNVGR